MQVIWCLKFGNMTKSGGTIPPLQILGGICPPLDLRPCIHIRWIHDNYKIHRVYHSLITLASPETRSHNATDINNSVSSTRNNSCS